MRKFIQIVAVVLCLMIVADEAFAKKKGRGGRGGRGGGRGAAIAPGGGGRGGGGKGDGPIRAGVQQPDSPDQKYWREQLWQARHDLKRLSEDLRAAYVKTPEMKTLAAEFDEALSAQGEATEEVMSELRANPQYITALEKQKAAAAEMDRQKKTGIATFPELTNAATVLMEYNGLVLRMETDATKSSAKLRDANDKVAGLKARMATAEAEYQMWQESQPSWEEALTKVDNAVQKLEEATARARSFQPAPLDP